MLLLQVNHKRATGHMRMIIISHSPLQRSIKSADVGTVPRLSPESMRGNYVH